MNTPHKKEDCCQLCHGEYTPKYGEGSYRCLDSLCPCHLPTPPQEKGWIKEFEERFIREDGVLNIGKYDENTIKAFIQEQINEAKLEAAREIGAAAAKAGLPIIRLDSVSDWERARKQIEERVREEMVKRLDNLKVAGEYRCEKHVACSECTATNFALYKKIIRSLINNKL